jgi:hypothetical protein
VEIGVDGFELRKIVVSRQGVAIADSSRSVGSCQLSSERVAPFQELASSTEFAVDELEAADFEYRWLRVLQKLG